MPLQHRVAALAAAVGLLACTTSALAAPIPPALQQAALKSFFAATGGPSWVDDSGWTADPIACDAKGLTCDANGNVLEIFLVDNGLQGELPASLADIESLRGVVLNRNQLSGPIPPAWSNFNALQLLSLRDNAVDGPMAETLSSNLTLKVLDLCHNQLSGGLPAAYLDMPDLGTLALCNNDLAGALPDVGTASDLFDIDLSGNALSGAIDDSYFSLPALWHLNLSDNLFTGELPATLVQPAPLVVLDLADNQLTGALDTQLSQFPDLSQANLARNGLQGTLPESLHDLPHLRRLNLSGNRFTGSIPASLESHAGLIAGAAAGDEALVLDWNPVHTDEQTAAWLNAVGTDNDTLVSPVTDLSIAFVSDSTRASWTPHSFPIDTVGYYRIETSAGVEIGRTTDLTTGTIDLDTLLEIDPADLHVVTVLPAHDANPNRVESAASHSPGVIAAHWTPESVTHPANHGAFERRGWALASDTVSTVITEIDTPGLFEVQPSISSDGTLQFTPSGRVGVARAVATLTENGVTHDTEFHIAIGEAANRAPTFQPGGDLSTDTLGKMQVVEWASALSDGDDGKQTMQFVLDNPSPEWFAVLPELSVPSGTLRFRFKPGQAGSVSIAVHLQDDGGTENGGVDRSTTYQLNLRASDASQDVGGAGLASDGSHTGGGAASFLLWLSLLARRPRSGLANQ